MKVIYNEKEISNANSPSSEEVHDYKCILPVKKKKNAGTFYESETGMKAFHCWLSKHFLNSQALKISLLSSQQSAAVRPIILISY